jgi:hypothetical protein
VRPADVVHTGLGQPEVLDLPCRDEVFDCPGDVLDRYLWVDAVLVQQVDGGHAEPLQGVLDGGPDVLRPAVQTGGPVAVVAEAELGGNDDLVAYRRQGLADQGLVGERAVDLGGVEERDAAVDGGADQGDAVRVVDRRAEAVAQAHAAEADRGDFKSAGAEHAGVHRSAPH